MSTTETYVPAPSKQRYDDEIRASLKDELGLDSMMQSPRVTKITLNMGVGDATPTRRRSMPRSRS